MQRRYTTALYSIARDTVVVDTSILSFAQFRVEDLNKIKDIYSVTSKMQSEREKGQLKYATHNGHI